MLSTMKSAVIVAVCALGLTACNTTSPHHVSTSGSLYLNVGGGHDYKRHRHIRPHVRHIRSPIRHIRPPAQHIRPVKHHNTKQPRPDRGRDVKNNRPNRDRCKPQRRGNKHC